MVDLLAAHDITIYGDLSALATLGPTELKSLVLDNESFQFYLDSATDYPLDQIYLEPS